jgi:hypothetical protein
MLPETTEKLRGKGHEATDLTKVVNLYKNWHMQHTPKLEYYNFLDKVRKMNKKEVLEHVNKLRLHYKGEEMLEIFENVFAEAVPANQDT